jgi:hypothetical protein
MVFMYSNRYYCQSLMELELSRQIFEKYSDTKFHVNAPSGSNVVPCRRSDMTKLIIAFRNLRTRLETEQDYRSFRCVAQVNKWWLVLPRQENGI